MSVLGFKGLKRPAQTFPGLSALSGSKPSRMDYLYLISLYWND